MNILSYIMKYVTVCRLVTTFINFFHFEFFDLDLSTTYIVQKRKDNNVI